MVVAGGAAEAGRAGVVETVLLSPEVLVAVDRAVVVAVVLADPGAVDRAVTVLEHLAQVALVGRVGRVVFLLAAVQRQATLRPMRLACLGMASMLADRRWPVASPTWEPTTPSPWR